MKQAEQSETLPCRLKQIKSPHTRTFSAIFGLITLLTSVLIRVTRFARMHREKLSYFDIIDINNKSYSRDGNTFT